MFNFVIKDYETICLECGRFCDNGYCYECQLNLDTPLHDEKVALDDNDLWDYYYDGIEE